MEWYFYVINCRCGNGCLRNLFCPQFIPHHLKDGLIMYFNAFILLMYTLSSIIKVHLFLYVFPLQFHLLWLVLNNLLHIFCSVINVFNVFLRLTSLVDSLCSYYCIVFYNTLLSSHVPNFIFLFVGSSKEDSFSLVIYKQQGLFFYLVLLYDAFVMTTKH